MSKCTKCGAEVCPHCGKHGEHQRVGPNYPIIPYVPPPTDALQPDYAPPYFPIPNWIGTTDNKLEVTK